VEAKKIEGIDPFLGVGDKKKPLTFLIIKERLIKRKWSNSVGAD